MKFLESIALPIIVSALLALGLAAILSFPAHAAGDQPAPTFETCVVATPEIVDACVAAAVINGKRQAHIAALEVDNDTAAEHAINTHGGLCAGVVELTEIKLVSPDYRAISVTCLYRPNLVTYVVTFGPDDEVTATETGRRPAN